MAPCLVFLKCVIDKIAFTGSTEIGRLVGAIAGQKVGHTAVNVIPRYKDDKININWENKQITQEELQERVLQKLATAERKILQVLLSRYPDAVNNDELAQEAGYAATSGHFTNVKGHLRTLELIDYPQPGFSKASEILFINN